MNRNKIPALALVYAHILPKLQQAARDLGYALAIHGSMQTDFDLLAVPWTSNAVPAKELADAIKDAVGGVFGHPNAYANDEQPSSRPHGRLSWSIYLEADAPYIDLSVMPRKKK